MNEVYSNGMMIKWSWRHPTISIKLSFPTSSVKKKKIDCPLAQIRTDVKFLLCLNVNTEKVKIGLIKIGCFEVRRLNVGHLTFGMLFTVSLMALNGVESALWLARKSSKILCYSPSSNARGICARKYCNGCGNKRVKITFLWHIVSLLLYILKQIFT